MSEHTKSAAEPRSTTGSRPAAQRIQTKLAVSDRHDPMEHEADAVASRVVAGQPAPAVSRMAGPEKKKEPTAQRAAAPEKKEPTGSAQRAAAPDKKKPGVQRVAAPEKRKPEAPVQRQVDELENVQTKSAGDTGPAMGHVAQQAVDSKGSGRPLDSGVRSRIESSLGADMGHVRVHDDSSARAAAAALNARAFTHGSDIWMGPGESSSDLRLLAHEATHVVQQGAASTQSVMRTNGATFPRSTPTYNLDSSPPQIMVSQLPVPALKANPTTPITSFYRSKNYNRTGDPSQAPLQQFKWLREVASDQSATRLGTHGFQTGHPYFVKTVGEGINDRVGDRDRLADVLRIPFWSDTGTVARYDVDHVVELQLSGWPDVTTANEIGNLRLLESSANQAVGQMIGQNISDAVISTIRGDVDLQNALASLAIDVPTILAATSAAAKNRELGPVKSRFNIMFGQLVSNGSGPAPGAVSQWQASQVAGGAHIEALLGPRTNNPGVKSSSRIKVYNLGPEEDAGPSTPFNSRVADHVRAEDLIGSSDRIVLHVGELGGKKKRVDWTDIESHNVNRFSGLILGDLFKGQFDVTDLTFDRNSTLPQAGRVSGRLKSYPRTTLNLGGSLNWNCRRVPGAQFSGYLDYRDLLTELNNVNPNLLGMSPVQFDRVTEGPNGILIAGAITTDLPLISGASLDITIEGNDLRVSKTFDSGAFRVPSPFEVTGSSLTVFFGARSGFGVEGRVDFAVRRLGQGHLGAAASMGEGLSLEGGFDFDSSLFDRAHIDLWYRNEQFGGRGEIGIDQPNKIRGIRSANVTAEFLEGRFNAAGTVRPSIPGVQEAGLTITYSDADGLTIGGTLELAHDIPGIRSGSLEVTLRKLEEGWKVSATGTAQPAIPGIDSQLTVNYDDGAFRAEFSGAFTRGMLSGTVNVGVTNRSLDAAGEPTGEPLPGSPLIVFGSGSATVRIAPWLQGTVGVRFAPNGEVTVAGEIALPSQTEIFSRKQINKSLFNIAIQVPIFPGVVAEIGGGLSAEAGIGPGVIDQLRLGITYNPAHEERTHVTGDAHLNIPADAGLRLAVRAGIGLGITGASATGGLEIGGMLGLAGAAEAGVHIDWLPSTGLRIDAYGDIHAEPIFRFDISGYVSVRVLGFEVYDNTWRFASYEFGSNLRFGIRFPIHYVQGQPFDISLNDVEFTVPDIDPGAILRGLVDRIA